MAPAVGEGGGPRIAILGAGMGGLTLAGLLVRAGVDVTVYEQAGAFERVGTGIQVGPNAVRVLGRLGLAARLDAVAFRPAHWRNRDGRSGELLNELPLGETANARFGAPYYVLHRADLHAVLRTGVPGRCIVLDHRLTGLEPDGDGVTMRFANLVRSIPEEIAWTAGTVEDTLLWNPEFQLSPIGDFADFVFASRSRALKLRYIARLFAKELVFKNFPGAAPEELLERLVELSLYTEEHLR